MNRFQTGHAPVQMVATCEGPAGATGRAGVEPGAERRSDGCRGLQSVEERRQGFGVQEHHDGSEYEGEFVNGLKHGRGKYTWSNGEYYEGSFYKDYKHGDAVYCWPTGHKFTGKFYLDRKEGYGHQLFPDGTTFQGLYYADKRFGPGVVSYPDGRADVGLWVGHRLLYLCAPVEESFTLKNFPEYAVYMEPAAATDPLTQSPSSGLQTDARTGSMVQGDTDRALPIDDDSILPPGIEWYSKDGDHLPLPPGRRRELDKLFYGELWEPDPYQGYERYPLSSLPLEARMRAHIHKHRLLAEKEDWDVAAVLSRNREGFGPKGPLEVNSELLIQHASRGEFEALSKILRSGTVHPDVADSQGHTALIAATVNCHNDVIDRLLCMCVNLNKLNREGMSALAVCHVLYYPFQSLHTALTGPPGKPQVLRPPATCENSAPISQVDLTTDSPGFNNRPQTSNTTLNSQTNQSHLSDKTAEERAEHIFHHCSKVSNDSETPADTEHLQEEGEGGKRDSKETGDEAGGKGRRMEDEKLSKGEERKTESRCDQLWENGEGELKGEGKKEGGSELGKRRQKESGSENMEAKVEEAEEDVEKGQRNIHEEEVKEGEERGSEGVSSLRRCIQVLDGHIALGSVPWKECRATAAGRAQQGKGKEPSLDSARSISSYNIQVTEKMMQLAAEALSRTGIPQSSDTKETVRKMASMKTEHRARLSTLKLLLERGADPNVSRVPMPVLFLAIMAADAEVVKTLLLSGARTDIPLPPERKGLYPLHVAAALPGPAGPRITEMLLHALSDPDARACDHDEIYEPDKAQELLSTNDSPHLKEGGRTALHVACQRDSDYRNASEVVALLLSHRASTDLLWSGHSPLSLAIATGNDLAVEVLLNGGANPNIPLGHRVGSALCALANINYHLGGNRAKLLGMLAKAGANILMPVTVGDVVGTAVDYANYSFSQNSRIANTPFHALNKREQETFKARRQLLSMMADLQRQAAGQKDMESLQSKQHRPLNRAGAISSNVPLSGYEKLPPITEKHRKPALPSCQHCGRSVPVEMIAGNSNKVFYCSKTCKVKACNEDTGVPGHQAGIKASPTKSKTPAKPNNSKASPTKNKTRGKPINSSVRRPPQAEKVLEGHAILKENYSNN